VKALGRRKRRRRVAERDKRSHQGREKRNTSTTKRVEEMTEIGREKKEEST